MSTKAPPSANEMLDPRIRGLLAGMEAQHKKATEEMVAKAKAEGKELPKPGFTRQDCLEAGKTAEPPFAELSKAMGGNLDVQGVETEEFKVKGIDGNEVPVLVYTPTEKNTTSTIVYNHGGGMALFTYKQPHYVRFCKDLAAMGVRVCVPGFRNSIDNDNKNTFPAGLNDCYSAAMWAADTYKDKVVVAGESGGGNLSIAVSLKALKTKTDAKIKGVYAMCPYIAGKYANPSNKKFPSHGQWDGYLLASYLMEAMARVYTKEGESWENPLAWPSLASENDVKGFPPTVISVNEFDPLKDEGLAFYRLLLKAGVKVQGKIICGTIHAADTFPELVPEIVSSTQNAIVAFANSL